MRLFFALLVFMFLVGCAAQQSFDVTLSNASHEDVFVQNKTLDKISFIIQNNEEFDLDCNVLLSLNNGTNTSTRKGVVGILEPAEQKKVALSFEMFYGKTDIKIEPKCKKH